jgi:hypothetical protein
MRLYLLIFLSILSGICLIVLIFALTDVYPVKLLSDNRTTVVVIFLMIGGFTRQAFKKYRDQLPN